MHTMFLQRGQSKQGVRSNGTSIVITVFDRSAFWRQFFSRETCSSAWPSKGMEHRAICPLHGGSKPTQFWVDIAEGNYCCFSCGAKGRSAYTFEQALLIAEGRSPSHDEVMRSLEQVLGTPFVERTYPEAFQGGAKKGRDRKQARDFYRYTDELGDELFTV